MLAQFLVILNSMPHRTTDLDLRGTLEVTVVGYRLPQFVTKRLESTMKLRFVRSFRAACFAQ
jgi:hypothetical protein